MKRKLRTIWIIILTVIGGILYRLGGTGGAWWKNTKMRDVGVALVSMIAMMILFDSPWWAHLTAFIMLFGALCTYWDKVFGYDNHYAHGFMCAIAYFPYAIDSGNWIGLGIRCVALCLMMGVISGITKNDVVEEVGRGGSVIVSLPLL